MAEGVGFLGLGRMGEPMAINLARAGVPLTVWNRSEVSAARLAEHGARVAATPADVFEACDVIIAMMANGEVLDQVLGRRDGDFAVPLDGRTVVNMGTVAPAYSLGLAADLVAAGAAFVEAPVSGSRTPAQEGRLVAMLAGDVAAVARVEALLAPMCATTFHCGPVPRALEMKLAVNVFLIAMVTGLAEAMRFGASRGLDLGLLRAVLDAGPMASDVSRLKTAKLVAGDYAPQASVRDVHYNSRLIVEAAQQAGAAVPLLEVCAELFAEAERLGHGEADMVAVAEALQGGHARQA